MKKILLGLLLLVILFSALSIFSKTNSSITCSQIETTNLIQDFLSEQELYNKLKEELKPLNVGIEKKYLSFQYTDMDQDPELELMVSYRWDIHKGIFIVYNYSDGMYKKIFFKEWAVEKMNPFEIIVASGDEKIHQLMAYMVHMEQNTVKTMWNAIIEKYDYSNLSNGKEIHGHYYVDTNSLLHYFYKIESIDKNAKVIKKEYKEEEYLWDQADKKYKKIS